MIYFSDNRNIQLYIYLLYSIEKLIYSTRELINCLQLWRMIADF